MTWNNIKDCPYDKRVLFSCKRITNGWYFVGKKIMTTKGIFNRKVIDAYEVRGVGILSDCKKNILPTHYQEIEENK